jgi:hypothetical protein
MGGQVVLQPHQCAPDNASRAKQLANANLIAAAPSLLAALADVELRTTQARMASGIGNKPLRYRVDFLLSEMERIASVARAAINQAEGPTNG